MDVSSIAGRASAPVTEAMLFRAYDVGELREEACQCGGWVIADPLCPMADVAEHNASDEHLAWRRARA